MMNYLNLFKPVNCYVASGWSVSKNHLFELESNYFLARTEQEGFWDLKEFFIDQSIFLSKLERPLNVNSSSLFVAVADVGCRIVDESIFSLKYDVNLWLAIKKNKKSKSILSLSINIDDAVKAGEVLSKFIELVSHQEIVDINTGELVPNHRDIIIQEVSPNVVIDD